ncbi:MAG: alpha/beta-type small acid-soluble spore protein [Clostridia bacterium]|nr:alpha/beta-type small acid-soluble spore protein [Clostridia bacterium]
MGQGQRTNRLLIPQARAAMEKFKYEMAQEVGLNVMEGSYWGDIPSRQCGAVGGHMVRKMIRSYEEQLANQSPTTVSFNQAGQARTTLGTATANLNQ